MAKRAIKIFAICICALFICSGCEGETEKQTAGEDGLVTMSAALTEDETVIVTSTIFNKTEKDIETGEEYTLEVLKDGSFVEVPRLNSVAFNLGLIHILSGDERSYRVDIGRMYGDLAAGRYRIVKKYWVRNREKGSRKKGNTDKETVTAEFDLE